MNRIWTMAAAAVAALAVAAPAPAATLNTFERGWYDSTGFHDPANDNYISGQLSGTEYHDFFVFDLTGVSGPLTSASVTAFNPDFNNDSGGGPLTFTLYDYTGSITDLINGTGGVAAFADLGSGTALGSVVVSDADDGAFVTVSLNAAGLAYLNANLGGEVAIGGALAPLDFVGFQYVYGFSGSGDPADGNTFLTFDTGAAVPAPAGLVLLAAAAPVLGLRRALRRKLA
ncbi:MAG: hypothetical protein K2X87_14820 [Gemmataceae bacterium]|nr:hypothetical protein [Gemmataceae bacterium]